MPADILYGDDGRLHLFVDGSVQSKCGDAFSEPESGVGTACAACSEAVPVHHHDNGKGFPRCADATAGHRLVVDIDQADCPFCIRMWRAQSLSSGELEWTDELGRPHIATIGPDGVRVELKVDQRGMPNPAVRIPWGQWDELAGWLFRKRYEANSDQPLPRRRRSA